MGQFLWLDREEEGQDRVRGKGEKGLMRRWDGEESGQDKDGMDESKAGRREIAVIEIE